MTTKARQNEPARRRSAARVDRAARLPKQERHFIAGRSSSIALSEVQSAPTCIVTTTVWDRAWSGRLGGAAVGSDAAHVDVLTENAGFEPEVLRAAAEAGRDAASYQGCVTEVDLR